MKSFGLHLSKEGNLLNILEKSERFGIDTVQIFAGSPMSVKGLTGEIKGMSWEDFREEVKRRKLRIYVHGPYIANLAAGGDKKGALLRFVLEECLGFSKKIGAEGFVMHQGSHMGLGDEVGLKNIAWNLHGGISDFVKRSGEPPPMILIENCAGGGTHIVRGDVLTLAGFVREFNQNFVVDRVGLCFDTAHAFAAGFNFDDENLERIKDVVKLVHLNDCPWKVRFGAHLDRHEVLGKGVLGPIPREVFVKFECPFVAERTELCGVEDLRVMREWANELEK